MYHSALLKALRAQPWLIVLGLASLCGCAELDQTGEANNQDKIINGNDESGHPYVVSLISPQGSSYCTGTLIAPSVVLTAAHCILDGQGLDPPTMVEIGSFIGVPSNPRIPVSSYLIREGWELRTGGFDYNFDIALLYLSSRAPVSGIAYSRVSPQEVINRSILAVGYGNNNGFQGSGGGVKRSVNLTITESHQFHFIATWLDGVPLDTCQGDSGGPALFSGDRGMEVLGVVSNGPTFCQGSTQYTTVASHAFWIDQNLNNPSAGTPTQSGAQDPSAQVQYSTCSELLGCARSCQERYTDQASVSQCQNQCVTLTSTTAQDHYIELKRCVDACGSDTSCQANNCADQMSLCGITPPDPGGSPQAPPITSCRDLYSCDQECRRNATDADSYGRCAMLCYNRADSGSINQLNQLQSCESRLSPTCVDQACYERECGDEIRACGFELSSTQPTSPPAQEGERLNCTGVYSCMAGCDGESCLQACFERGSSSASMIMNNLITCYNGNSCDSFFNYECMSNECPGDFGACLND